jgi:hypothetical protein
MISRASANMLFGEPPAIHPTQDSDAENLDRILDDNQLTAEIHRAAVIASSEGEVWGRILVDPSVLDVPIVEFASRSQVIPHFVGRFVRGATFVTTWATTTTERLRLLESYEPGAITTRLFRGTTSSLGSQVGLDSFGPTKGRTERVLTGIDHPLCAFIPNSIDADPTRGFSDYSGVEGRFLALNEAASVGASNLRLAGAKRALVDARYMTEDGRVLPGDDIFIRSTDLDQLGDNRKPVELLEYSFEAGQVIAWIEHLIDSTLTFAGVSPQSVGRAIDGGAVSGTALRLKMAHSLMEAAGKGRYFDAGIKRLLRAAAVLDSRSTFGRKWAESDADPDVTRGDGLPRDDMEAAQWVAMLVGAESISVEERVRFLHPDWDDEKVTEEVDRLERERPTAAPAPGGFATPRPQLRLQPGGIQPPGPRPPGEQPAPAPLA